VATHKPTSGQSAVRSLAPTPTGETLVLGSDDGTIKLWDKGRDQETILPQEHQASVLFVACVAGGHDLVSLSQDGHLLHWDLNRRAKQSDTPLPEEVAGAALAADGRHLAVANTAGTVYILRLAPATVR
jgi:WD40 repeat protein